MKRKLILLGIALAVAAAIGLVANVLNLDQRFLSALVGAAIALLVAFGLPFAFSVPVEGRNRMQPQEAAVVADDHEDWEAVPNDHGFRLSNGLQQPLLLSDAPVMPTTRWAESASTTFAVEVRDEFREVSHPVLPLEALIGNGSSE